MMEYQQLLIRLEAEAALIKSRHDGQHHAVALYSTIRTYQYLACQRGYCIYQVPWNKIGNDMVKLRRIDQGQRPSVHGDEGHYSYEDVRTL